MAIPFPIAQQSSLQPSDTHCGNSLTIIGSVCSAGDPNISKDLTILGDLSTTGSVTVDGVVEGNIYCTSLIITANGRVNGGIVAIQDVVVRGKVTGAIRSRRVLLKSSARVEGDIFYQRIGIEMGAHHDGMLHRTGDEHVCDEPNSPTLGNEDSYETAWDTAKSQSLAECQINGYEHPDDMHERQTRASSKRGGPNRRFSMYDFEQKRYREDALRHETGVLSPGE